MVRLSYLNFLTKTLWTHTNESAITVIPFSCSKHVSCKNYIQNICKNYPFELSLNGMLMNQMNHCFYYKVNKIDVCVKLWDHWSVRITTPNMFSFLIRTADGNLSFPCSQWICCRQPDIEILTVIEYSLKLKSLR